MAIPEVIAAIKDVLISIAAATTAVVAVLGLKSWSRELRGKTSFEAARSLARATYKLRDELKNCRAPWVGAHEFPAGYKGGWNKQEGHEEAEAWAHIYKNRWGPVWSALQEFDSSTLEAEALWGSAIRTKTDKLRECVRTVNAAIDTVIRDKAAGGVDFASDRDFGKEMRAAVSASPTDGKNQVSISIQTAVRGIEEEIQPHLRRG